MTAPTFLFDVDLSIPAPQPPEPPGSALDPAEPVLGAPPVIDSVAPDEGIETGGTESEIRGARFQQGATVTVGGAAATAVTVVSKILIRATTPAGTVGAQDVVVENPDEQTATLEEGFTYTAAPAGFSVTSIDPVSGTAIGGDAFTITGTGFDTETSATVTFGIYEPLDPVVVVNSTTITGTTPFAETGTVTVTVTQGANSDSLVDGFTFT